MSLECKVKVFLNNLTPQKSDAIQKALTPDNINFPENFFMHIESVNNSLVFTFQGKGNIRTLISTIDEVLEHVQVVLRVTG
jgi:hypothetical protein